MKTEMGFVHRPKLVNTRKLNVSETAPISETLCFLGFRILDDGQSPLKKTIPVTGRGGL
jgi:hypothetical protein